MDAIKSRPTCGALLAVVAAEERLTRDQAALLLYPDSDARRARQALNQAVYQVRRLLGREWILTRGPELGIGEGIGVDAVQAKQAFETGDFSEVLELTRGRFLEGWHLRSTEVFEEWVHRKDRAHRALFRDAARRLVTEALGRDDVEGAIVTARRWVAVEPTLEEANLRLLRGLVTLGRHSAASDAYESYARRLAEVGGVPGPEVVSLRRAAEGERSAGSVHPMGRTPVEVPHRILVLPFAHAGPVRHAHRTDGVTDEVTVRLSRDPGLAVIARPTAIRIDTAGRTLVEIGRQLEVDSVLEGRVRWIGERGRPSPRISVQHVRVATGAQLWAADLEASGEERTSVAARVVRRVSRALGLRRPWESGDDGGEGRARSPAAELCTRGLQHWHRRSQGELRKAIDLFVQAIEVDPEYAHPYGCLALAYGMMPSFAGLSPLDWMPRAKLSLRKALELDPELMEAHMAAGLVAWTFDLDVGAAGRHWDRALNRQPSNAQVLVWEAYRRTTLGDDEEGRACIRRARALDPLSVAVNFDAGMVERILGDDAVGVEQMRRVLVMDPDFTPAAFVLGAVHMRRGEVEEARLAWKRVHGFGPAWETFLSSLGDPERAIRAVDRIVSLSPQPVHWYASAVLYALLGEGERSIRWIEAHVRTLRGEPGPLPTGGPGPFIAARDPFFDLVRPTPRFRAVLRALGLPPP